MILKSVGLYIFFSNSYLHVLNINLSLAKKTDMILESIQNMWSRA